MLRHYKEKNQECIECVKRFERKASVTLHNKIHAMLFMLLLWKRVQKEALSIETYYSTQWSQEIPMQCWP